MLDSTSEYRKLEDHLRGPEQRSLNWKVARDALKLAKTQQEYEISPTPSVLIPQPPPPGDIPYTSPNDSSSPPGPSRPRGPPPSSPLRGTSAILHQPPASTRDARRRRPTVANGITASGKWVFDESGASINSRYNRSGQDLHPRRTDIDTDMGYRTARSLSQRHERGTRGIDEAGNIAWRQPHHSDDKGH